MFSRIFTILVGFLSFALVSGCASDKSTAQSDPNSTIQEAPSGREIHGEVGAMYGSGNLSRH
jgi:hypothetical protein